MYRALIDLLGRRGSRCGMRELAGAGRRKVDRRVEWSDGYADAQRRDAVRHGGAHAHGNKRAAGPSRKRH